MKRKIRLESLICFVNFRILVVQQMSRQLMDIHVLILAILSHVTRYAEHPQNG